MRNNDLVVLLSKLSKKDVKDFYSFVKKNYFKAKTPIKLLEFLRKHHPTFDAKKVTFEKAYATLFDHAPYNRKRILNELSELRGYLRTFLVFKFHDELPLETDFILLQVYKKYNLEKQFEKQLRSVDRQLSRLEQRDMWFWLNKMRLEHEQYFYVETDRVAKRLVIFDAMKNLDLFYAASKLRYSSELYNGYQVMGEDEPEIWSLGAVEQSPLVEQSIYHQLYKRALLMLRQREESSYHALKKQFFERHAELTKQDQLVIISYLLNHTSYEIRKGNDAFVQESFELFRFGIPRQVFTINGVIPTEHLLNAIDVAGKLKEFEWARVTLKKWGTMIELDNREYYLTLANVIIEFRQEHFERCTEILAQFDLKQPQDQIRWRWLKIMSHYEIKSAESFILDQCIALEKYVRRNKRINESRKKGVLHSIKVLRLLLKPEPNTQKIDELLSGGDNFHYKSWLLDKRKEL